MNFWFYILYNFVSRIVRVVVTIYSNRFICITFNLGIRSWTAGGEGGDEANL